MRRTSWLLVVALVILGVVACSQDGTNSDGDGDIPDFDGDIVQPDGDAGDGDEQPPDGDREDDPVAPDGDTEDGDQDTVPNDGDDTPADGDDDGTDGDEDGDLDTEEDVDIEEPEDLTLCPESQRCRLISGGPRVCLTPEGTVPPEATTSCNPADAASCSGNMSCVCLDGDCSASGGVCLERCGACRHDYSCRLLNIDGDFSCKSGTGRWPDDVVANCHEGATCPDGTYCHCQSTGIGGACNNSVCAESCTGVMGDDLCPGDDMACGPVPSHDPFVFGCLYGGAFIPENARRQCFRYDEEKCPSGYSCHCLDGTGLNCHQSVCIKNCGRCKEGETCGGSLLLGGYCLVGGQVPPDAITGCGGIFAETSCPQNYVCELVGMQYVCLQLCSTP